ncbi:MAG: nucleoside hydrolase [Acidobacteria bacterium]|nr:nucleoside hydrolase [Acidobacteriota bacterium]
MTKKTILSILLVLVFSIMAFPHDYKQHVIIDTDCGADDLRAISLILNNPDIVIDCIIVTEGSLDNRRGLKQINELLGYFSRRNIQVYNGKSLNLPAPPWREKVASLRLGKKQMLIEKHKPYNRIIPDILNTHEGAAYICLGPATTIAAILADSNKLRGHLSEILFFGTHYSDSEQDWNSSRDKKSASVLKNFQLPVRYFRSSKVQAVPADRDFRGIIKKIDSDCAKLISLIFTQLDNKGEEAPHFKIWDDLIPVYLAKPGLFKFIAVDSNKNEYVLTTVDGNEVKKVYLDLAGESPSIGISPRNTVVLKSIPVNAISYRTDLAPYVKEIIKTHGIEEWKAAVLTNEFHRHLGIYSIIGVKMGIRAREILGAPFDELEVITYAGQEPPLSCMIDGLQVSTGASLGRGSIRVEKDKTSPIAIFKYENRTVELFLKDSVISNIKRDIKKLTDKYGFQGSDYFQALRELSIQYWLNLNRKEIFIEK